MGIEILFLKVFEGKNQSWIQDDDTSRELSMIGQPPFRATILYHPAMGSLYPFIFLFSSFPEAECCVGEATGEACWEPCYCVLLQDEQTLTAYRSEDMAVSTLPSSILWLRFHPRETLLPNSFLSSLITRERESFLKIQIQIRYNFFQEDRILHFSWKRIENLMENKKWISFPQNFTLFDRIHILILFLYIIYSNYYKLNYIVLIYRILITIF